MYKHLDSYVELYREGTEQASRYLPKLIIYFRQAFEKLGIMDDRVPYFFNWDQDLADEFLSWGHNSRWNYTFNICLSCYTNDYVELLKQEMRNKGIKDFKVIIPKDEMKKT